MRRPIRVILFALSLVGLAAATLPATATHNADRHSPNMAQLFTSPNGRDQTNSDQAFWGKYAYQGDYGGLRIFDISNPAAPTLAGNLVCNGAQNDVNVWDRDGNGQADIAFLSIDRTQVAGPTQPDPSKCGSVNSANHDEPRPAGWEGLRIVDIANPAAPTQIGAVYLDCGSHTNTLWPDPANNRVLLYNSSYPLRPGPTCGSLRGPQGSPPHPAEHGVIQVVEVKWNPASPLGAITAAEIAEPKIVYPGDPDNKFTPAEHGLPGPPALEAAMRACHDISVFVPLRLAAAACAEQAQLWRVLPNGLPDTEHPIWVYDDTVDETGSTGSVTDTGIVVDFWHSATFSWDGKVVHFEDESFDAGECPPVTDVPATQANRQPGDTGRMFLFDTQTGALISQFMPHKPWEADYCSAHLGNFVPATDKYLLPFGWYMGGATVIDFTNPSNPKEVAYYDAAGPPPDGPSGVNGADFWTTYWYEGPSLPGTNLTLYATDGVHDPQDADGGARGFVVLRADVTAAEVNLSRLNPQTQERMVPDVLCKGKVATIIGSEGNDILTGTTGNDVISTLGGRDRVNAGSGNDTVCLGKGRDTGKGGSGKDRLWGDAGQYLGLGKLPAPAGTAGRDTLNGGSGRDFCHGGPKRDTGKGCEKEKSIER